MACQCSHVLLTHLYATELTETYVENCHGKVEAKGDFNFRAEVFWNFPIIRFVLWFWRPHRYNGRLLSSYYWYFWFIERKSVMSRKPSRCMLVAKVLIGRWLACCLFLEVFWEPLLLCFVPQKFNYLKQVAQLRPGVEPLRSKGAVLRMTRGGAWLPIVCWDGLLLVVILAGTPLLGDPRQCSNRWWCPVSNFQSSKLWTI